MKENFYWSLFWRTGSPEVWMMSRPIGNDLFLAEMASRDLRLPKEARQLQEKQKEQPAAQSTQSGPTAES